MDSVSLWSLQVRAIQRNILHRFFTQKYKNSWLPWWLSSKNLPANQDTQVQSLGQEDLLKKEVATHSSTFICDIPWTDETGGLQFMGSQRVRYDLVIKQHKKKLHGEWGKIVEAMPQHSLAKLINWWIYLFINLAMPWLRCSMGTLWLRLHAPNERGLGSIPAQGTRSQEFACHSKFYFFLMDWGSINNQCRAKEVLGLYLSSLPG